MDAASQRFEVEKKALLRRLAELLIEQQVAEGVYLGTPHYSLIERQAIALGRELSQQAQERSSREVAARHPTQAACPRCQAACKVEVQTRRVTSLDGPVELTETTAHCNRCRRSFFPSADRNGAG